MSAELFDAAMRAYGGSEWSLNVNPLPQCGHKNSGDIEDPITLTDFLQGACRSPVSVKTVTILFEPHLSAPEIGGMGQIGHALQNSDYGTLPPVLQPSEPLPAGAKMSVVIRNHGDGLCDILKIYHFPDKLATRVATRHCSGEVFVPVFRQGPWAVKKATQSLVDRLPGYHIMWQSLSSRETPGMQRKGSNQWSPDIEQLREGVEYINKECPECDAKNEQYLWVLSNIKEDSGSPIAGWPEAKVTKMAANKSRGQAGAESHFQFPLQTYSLKAPLSEVLLPLVYPLLTNYGVWLVGWPRVGKTPLFIIMAMALGRLHVRRLQLPGAPGWRRAKSLDNVRHRFPKVQEALFLDDPSIEKLDVEDLKSFLTVDEDGTCSARYNDVKLARNCMRGIATNDISEDAEPGPDNRSNISHEEFLAMFNQALPWVKPAHTMAVLKRSIVFIFGRSALYVRLPSEKDTAPVHRVTDMDVHKDVLTDVDKPFYGRLKAGSYQEPANFTEDVQREQDMLDERMAEFGKFDHPDEYIKVCNDAIKVKLTPVRIIPGSPVSDSEEVPLQPDGTWLIPQLRTGPSNSSKRSKFQPNFEISQKKVRIKGKSSPAAGAFDGDEEASMALYGKGGFDLDE